MDCTSLIECINSLWCGQHKHNMTDWMRQGAVVWSPLDSGLSLIDSSNRYLLQAVLLYVNLTYCGSCFMYWLFFLNNLKYKMPDAFVPLLGKPNFCF